MVLTGTYLYLWVQQARGTNQLFHHNAFGFVQLIFRWRGADINDLVYHVVKFLKAQGSVVKRRRQTETILHQVLFPSPVAAIHGPDLWNAHVAFVNEEQVILWEKVQETIRPLPRFPPVEVTGIILYARAVAQLLDHLDIIFHSLLDALRLDIVAQLLEIGHLFHQVVLYHANSLVGLFLRGDKKVGGVYVVFLHGLQAMVRLPVKRLDGVYLVIPPCHADNLVAVGKKHVYSISLDPEIAPLRVNIVPHVEGGHQLAQELIAVKAFSPSYSYDTLL